MIIEIDDLLLEKYRKIEGFSSRYSNEEVIISLVKKQLVKSGIEEYQYHIFLKTFFTKYKFYKDVREGKFFEDKKFMLHLQFDNLKFIGDFYGHDEQNKALLDIQSEVINIFPLNSIYILNLDMDNLDIGIILNENKLPNLNLKLHNKINTSFAILDLQGINLKNFIYENIVNSLITKSEQYNINHLISILFNIRS